MKTIFLTIIFLCLLQTSHAQQDKSINYYYDNINNSLFGKYHNTSQPNITHSKTSHKNIKKQIIKENLLLGWKYVGWIDIDDIKIALIENQDNQGLYLKENEYIFNELKILKISNDKIIFQYKKEKINLLISDEINIVQLMPIQY